MLLTDSPLTSLLPPDRRHCPMPPNPGAVEDGMRTVSVAVLLAFSSCHANSLTPGQVSSLLTTCEAALS